MTEAWWNTKSYVKSRLGSNNCRSLSVFPAPAGMSRGALHRSRHIIRVPRARGDEPSMGKPASEIQKCSPRPRG